MTGGIGDNRVTLSPSDVYIHPSSINAFILSPPYLIYPINWTFS
ncbi:hypothetical protein ACFVR1_14490 [Psychrobacillus sp. NPDC058041]